MVVPVLMMSCQVSEKWKKGPLMAHATSTTIITFLMVFLIQNTQNRDAIAIHLKLDELIKGVKGARTSLVNLEQLSDEDLESLQKEFERIHHSESHHIKKRKPNANDDD